MSLEAKLQTAITAARKAGRIITQHYDNRQDLDITEKGLNDFASNVDKMAQDVIVATLQRAYPDDGIVAEEGFVALKGDNTWVIDPLDGTRNFINGFPQFAVSIALNIKNRVELGLVYDPLKNELFTAIRGSGARLDNTRIRVNKPKAFAYSLIGTGFPTRYPELLEPYLETFNNVLPKVCDIRRAGSAALDLAYVACGRLDAVWEPHLKFWDIAAGMLLVNEAGGLSSNFLGQDNLFESSDISKNYDIVSGSITTYKELVKLLPR